MAAPPGRGVYISMEIWLMGMGPGMVFSPPMVMAATTMTGGVGVLDMAERLAALGVGAGHVHESGVGLGVVPLLGGLDILEPCDDGDLAGLELGGFGAEAAFRGLEAFDEGLAEVGTALGAALLGLGVGGGEGCQGEQPGEGEGEGGGDEVIPAHG
jgi:hypothetical protein